MLFLYYPKCSTCQKAKKWLLEHHVAFEDRHIVERPPTVEELQKWAAQSGLQHLPASPRGLRRGKTTAARPYPRADK